MLKTFATAMAAASMTLAGSAWAAPIYQSIPDLKASPIVRGYCSACDFIRAFRIYDRFTIASPGVVSSVTFAVDRQNIAGTSLSIGFFGTNGARPGASIANYDVNFADIAASQQSTDLENVFLYTAPITALALGAGTYDISFFNPNGLSIPAYAKAGGNLYQSGTFFFPENFYPDQAAGFSLNALAPVPELATWAMMILGMGAIGLTMRRRQVVRTVVTFT